jgi:hypothetical protein
MAIDPQLARLLDGVKDAPNPGERLLRNCVEELDDDLFAAWDLAGFLLDNRDVIFCSLVRNRQ